MTDRDDTSATSARTRALAQSLGAGPRRWGVLAVIVLLNLVSAYNQLAVSILAPEITAQLGINNSQLAAVLTAPMLSGLFLAIAAGSLADRFGVKRVVGVAFFASLTGLVIRIFADDYTAYFAGMFLLGCANVIALANSARLLRAWFSPRELSVAFGVLLAAGPAGSTLAQLTVALFPSAVSFYWTGAALYALVLVLWFVLVQNTPAAAEARATGVKAKAEPTAPVLESVKSALRNPHVLLIGVCAALFGGAQFSISGFLPTALVSDRGMELSQAGVLAALSTVGTFVGNLVCPIIAARIGRNKPVIIGSALACGVLTIAAWLLSATPVFPVLVLLAGVALGGTIPLVIAAPALLGSVAARHVGGAGGVVSTIESAGVFVIPTFVIAAIAGTDYTLLFTLTGVCAALMAVVIVFVPEYGHGRAARRFEPN